MPYRSQALAAIVGSTTLPIKWGAQGQGGVGHFRRREELAGLRARLHDAADEPYSCMAASFWRRKLGAKILVIEATHL
jgi:hypothetical protein